MQFLLGLRGSVWGFPAISVNIFVYCSLLKCLLRKHETKLIYMADFLIIFKNFKAWSRALPGPTFDSYGTRITQTWSFNEIAKSVRYLDTDFVFLESKFVLDFWRV